MATFIKAGFWEKLCQKCTGYKGWLNLDLFVQSKIPQPTYKVYTATLYQDGTNDPTVTILENTLGFDITWTRDGIGQYRGTFSADQDITNFFALTGLQNIASAPVSGKIIYTEYNSSFVNLTTVNTDEPPINSDGVLWQTPIEIRVYN